MKVCWNITSKCNRNCKFCFREKDMDNLLLDESLCVLDSLVKLGIDKITYAGGEPLLYDGIEKLFKASKEKGIYNKLNTNGGLLNKDNITKYLKYIDKIGFSIDSSSDEENYFLGRGSSHYKHLKDIIPAIKEKYPKIKIDVNTVVTGQTINGLNELYLSLTKDFGEGVIDRWKFIRFCPFRNMSDEDINKFQISDDEFLKVKEKFMNENLKFPVVFVDIDEMDKKNIVNQSGIIEMYKDGKRVFQNLINNNLSIKQDATTMEVNNNFLLNTNLNLYKNFYEVAKLGSLSLASKKMFISQPAISRSIKKLEEELDVVLFYRTINGMNLTPKGKELYRYVEEAYNIIKTAERSMMETNNLYKGKLIIGIPSHIASFYLFKKIKKFHEDYPKIEISIISRSTADLIKRLENHELDFAIDASPLNVDTQIFQVEKLIDINYCFASLKKYDYSKTIIKIKDLENYPLILPVDHSYNRKRLNSLLINCDVFLKNIISIETTEMLKESILQGLGIGYILKNAVENEIKNGILEEIKIEEELPKLDINLVYIDKYLTNVPKFFIDNYLK